MEYERREVPGELGFAVDTNGIVWTRWSRHGARREKGQALEDAWGPLLSEWRKAYVKRDGKFLAVRLFTRRAAIHVLVLSVFVGPRPDGKLAMHRNRKTWDNRVENLFYGVQQDIKPKGEKPRKPRRVSKRKRAVKPVPDVTDKMRELLLLAAAMQQAQKES